MPTGNLTDTIKNWVIIIGGILGMSAGGAGLYAALAKPVQDEMRIKQLETKMAAVEPAIEQGKINQAVVVSRLEALDKNQNKILDIVLEIKRKL